MQVRVKLYAALRRYRDNVPAGEPFVVGLPEEATVGDLARYLGAPIEEVKMAFVNGRARAPDWVLQHGDEVGLFPPIGGG
jgi:sulfur-carrier protein